MNSLHTRLAKKYPWYADWHTIGKISLLHFVVLTGFVSATVLLLQAPLKEYADLELAAAGAARMSDARAPGQLLVQFKAGVKDDEGDALLKMHGGQKLKTLPQIRTHVISVPIGAEEKVRAALARNPKVEVAEPNFIALSTLVPNDTYYPNQWHSPKIGAPTGWDATVGVPSVIVAVADSGFLPIGDLATSLVPGYDVVTNTATVTTNSCAHGAKVAGVIGSAGNNAAGVAGLAWGSKIMPIAMADGGCYALYSNMAEAVIYAVDHGARVINISYGGTGYSSTLESAINYAVSKGAVFFASAGNDSASAVLYPAAYANAIGVGATGSSDVRASWSNYGTALDIVAPGVGIWSGNNSGTYGAVSGTSFASPLAAGLAALVLSVNPNLTSTQVRSLIEKNVDDLGTVGWDQYYGWGRINVAKTLEAAKLVPADQDTTAPKTSILAPSSGSIVSGGVSIQASASDNLAVAKVELYKDGTLFTTSSAGPFTFYWDTTADTNAKHTLQTKAYDAAGNVGTSVAISVTVANVDSSDAIAPKVTITSPTNGAKLKGNGSVNISVSASDASGISSIVISADGKQLGSCTVSTTCSATWGGKSISAGTHTITAVATDMSPNKNAATATATVTK